MDKQGFAFARRRRWVIEARLRVFGAVTAERCWCRCGLRSALVLGYEAAVFVARVPGEPTLTFPFGTFNVLLTSVITLEFTPGAISEKLLRLGSPLAIAMLARNLVGVTRLVRHANVGVVVKYIGSAWMFGFIEYGLNQVGDWWHLGVPIDEPFNLELHGFDP